MPKKQFNFFLRFQAQCLEKTLFVEIISLSHMLNLHKFMCNVAGIPRLYIFYMSLF